MVFCIRNCWCSYRDPIAYLSIPFAIGQISFVTYCMTFKLVTPFIKNEFLKAAILIFFYMILILICWSYAKCIFTEPGIVNSEIVKRIEEKDPNASNYRYCKKCKQLKPYHAHHCRRCQRCVLKLDHHCPWISNCVGVRNQKYFTQFLFYVIVDEVLAMIMTIRYFIYYKRRFMRYFHAIPFEYLFPTLMNYPKLLKFLTYCHIKFPYFEDQLIPQVVICIQAIFSAVFIIFCTILLYDQMKNIWYDTTYVEEANGVETDKKISFYESFVEYMGDPFGLYWFLPFEGHTVQQSIDDMCKEMVMVEHDKQE